MKRFFLILFVILGLLRSVQSQNIRLSEGSEISVLTCGASDLIHAIYGHTAIRVNDPIQHWDVVFNYGVFSFNAPNFVYRFAKGQTDYLLAPERYDSFYEGYVSNGRSVKEQVLNLTQEEKQQMLNFLIHNAKPENREYRYNFFYDNCATRVRDVIENQTEGKVLFSAQGEGRTFRQHAEEYQKILPWANFGIQLVLGSPSDRVASAYDEMFLPEYLYRQFAVATISHNGENRPLVKATNVIYQAEPVSVSWLTIHSPEFILLLALLLVFWISYMQLKNNRVRYGLDYLLLFIHGTIGFILLWFFLNSEHPAMKANYNQLWAVVFNLPFLFLWMVKKWRPLLRWYWVVLSAWLLLFFPLSLFLPQQFIPGFYLLVAMMLCRSLLHSRFLLTKNS